MGGAAHRSWWEFAGKCAVAHTVTYFAAGILAYSVMDYERTFTEPPLSCLMRPTTDPWVMAGPLWQPLRGLLFAAALYPLRAVLFGRPRGWLVLWWLLVAVGIVGTFGPAPGSLEGLIYTVLPATQQILGLWETILQALLFSFILFHWVNRPGHRWMNWVLGFLFVIVVVSSVLGLLFSR